MKSQAIVLVVFLIICIPNAFSQGEPNKLEAEITFHSNYSVTVDNVQRVNSERMTNLAPGNNFKVRTEDEDGNRISSNEFSLNFNQTLHRGYNETSGEVIIENKKLPNITRKIFLEDSIDAKYLIVETPRGSVEIDLVNRICVQGSKCTNFCAENDAQILECTCGNGMCDQGEDFEICPQDCADEIDNGESSKLYETLGDRKYVFIGIFLLIVLVVVYLVYSSMEVERDGESEETIDELDDLSRYNLED